jgi:Protein of unknown function (DUF2442)
VIAKVSRVSQHGIWLMLRDRELFLSYQDFPWFKDAPVSAVLNVQLPQVHHLYWPDLDIDLAVESIEHPERFPLIGE